MRIRVQKWRARRDARGRGGPKAEKTKALKYVVPFVGDMHHLDQCGIDRRRAKLFEVGYYAGGSVGGVLPALFLQPLHDDDVHKGGNRPFIC